ncbi:MAG: DUF6516 family protein [Candidatus Nanohalobium sp.]
MAEKLLEREFTTSDGTKIEVLAWKVPESEKYPEGIKYKFQAYRPEDGETILRYDNHNRHAGSRHHKHVGEDKTEATEFDSLQELYTKFIEEVKRHE